MKRKKMNKTHFRIWGQKKMRNKGGVIFNVLLLKMRCSVYNEKKNVSH